MRKKQEKVERFLLEPQYTPLFGITVTKDTVIDDYTEDKKVHQTIKDLVLTTRVKDNKKNEDYEIEEDSVLILKLKEGTRLLWTQTEGYILPQQKLVTRKEIRENLNYLDGIEGLE